MLSWLGQTTIIIVLKDKNIYRKQSHLGLRSTGYIFTCHVYFYIVTCNKNPIFRDIDDHNVSSREIQVILVASSPLAHHYLPGPRQPENHILVVVVVGETPPQNHPYQWSYTRESHVTYIYAGY